MNAFYNYEKKYLWYDDVWTDRNGLADPLLQWIGEHDDIAEPPQYDRPSGDPVKLKCYQAKANSVDLPEVIAYWADKGIRFTSLEQGKKNWISVLPERAMKKHGEKLITLVVLHQEDPQDPWWAMNTMTKYRAYNEMAARRQDTLIIYLTSKGADTDRIFGNILQEATCLYPADLDRVYLDLSLMRRKGIRLKDIPGFVWQDKSGETDPDSVVESFEGIPVLNISGRWGSADSLTRGLVMNHAMNRGSFDKERLIHSACGKRMADGIALEHKFSTVYDPGYEEYWNNMGLEFVIGEKYGHRWTMLVPKEQNEKKIPLPLVLAMQEVYRGNEHLAVTANAYFYEYAELAAQGECMVLFFALEDPDSNDLLADITEEVRERFHVDDTRIYVTGHSHDGWFARHFAYRHPHMIAALATMGNSVGHPVPEIVGNNLLGVSDEEIGLMSTIDMPTININGASEGFSKYPEDIDGRRRWAMDWQRRLKASRCPVKGFDEILAATESDNIAMRVLGVPGDRGTDFWLDGVTHYQVDVKNTDGKYHLRVASSENMPHTVTPCMIDLAWSYIRRFSRDTETGVSVDGCGG